MITEEHLTDEVQSVTETNHVRGGFEALPEVESEVVLVSNPITFSYWWLSVLLLPLGCAAGLALGLLVGWIVVPVEWDVDSYRSAQPINLADGWKVEYIEALSDRYAYDSDVEAVRRGLVGAGMIPDVCALMTAANHRGDVPEMIRLYALAYSVGEGGCQ